MLPIAANARNPINARGCAPSPGHARTTGANARTVSSSPTIPCADNAHLSFDGMPSPRHASNTAHPKRANDSRSHSARTTSTYRCTSSGFDIVSRDSTSSGLDRAIIVSTCAVTAAGSAYRVSRTRIRGSSAGSAQLPTTGTRACRWCPAGSAWSRASTASATCSPCSAATRRTRSACPCSATNHNATSAARRTLPCLPNAAGSNARAAVSGCRRNHSSATSRSLLTRTSQSAINAATSASANGSSRSAR